MIPKKNLEKRVDHITSSAVEDDVGDEVGGEFDARGEGTIPKVNGINEVVPDIIGHDEVLYFYCRNLKIGVSSDLLLRE